MQQTIAVEEMSEAEFADWMATRERLIEWDQYIHHDPNILLGKPVVRGTRLSVEFVLELYAAGWTEEQITENYPRLTHEALRAIFEFAAECVSTHYSAIQPQRTVEDC